jgi:tellurite resistance protein TerA
MNNLQPGQNISITQQNAAVQSIELALAWEPAATTVEIDTSAFALTTQGRVRGDDDFIFYNQPMLPGGGIQRSPDGKLFQVNFAQLPVGIEKIALVLTIHQGRRRGHAFSQLSQVRVEVRDAQSKVPIATFPLATGKMPETAIIAAELYQRGGDWKFRAVGQGFVGGLAPLARGYGVDVADDPDTAPAAQDKPAAPPAPPPRPVRLDKITLDKKQSISLEKKGQGFEEIVVNLNWSKAAAPSGGFMGRLLGSGQQRIDLDLGCLFKLRGGRAGAVQALGNSFGSLNQPPYIQLMGDDRSGESAAGEFLHINGRQWDQLQRVLIYAFIYEGAPNWAAADGVVTIKTPGQPALEVRLDSHSPDQVMCAIAMLENDAGNIRVSKLVEYFRDHQVMDRAYDFGLRWAAGSKD